MNFSIGAPSSEESFLAIFRLMDLCPSCHQERMQYLADEGTVLYSAKDGKERKLFDAPEWLAVMCSHVPNRGEQMARYYGWYSNVSRGKRQKETEENTIPHIMESNTSSTACRKSWARLIQKIYEVDPLICPKCRGSMRIISIKLYRRLCGSINGDLAGGAVEAHAGIYECVLQ
jgi:hypothetical protein